MEAAIAEVRVEVPAAPEAASAGASSSAAGCTSERQSVVLHRSRWAKPLAQNFDGDGCSLTHSSLIVHS